MNHLINPIPQKVTIVIAGRNASSYLFETLKSALSQSVKCDVVYVDDCSIDNSLSIAYSFSSLRVIPISVHSGVEHCRNVGALSSDSHFIIFMDADDVMPTDFVQLMLQSASLHPNAPFYFPNVQAFGGMSVLWTNRPWDGYDKWEHNQVSTTSMWSRQAFLAAGMWHKLPTMWDYDLALRCSRFGTPVPSKATLNYRIHSDSVSALLNERDPKSAIPYKELIRRKVATVGIGCLVSGRLPGLFPKWLDRIACSIRYSGLPFPKLLLLLDPKSKLKPNDLQPTTSKFANTFSSIEFGTAPSVTYPSPQEVNHLFPDTRIYPSLTDTYQQRLHVSTLLASSSNEMQHRLSTDIVWFIEDDILVPLKAYTEMFATLTKGATPPIGVSVPYVNRHTPDKYVGGHIIGGKHTEPQTNNQPLSPPVFNHNESVAFTGTGCLMYWRDRPATPRQWQPICKSELACAHDWAWSDEVKQLGGDIIMLGDLRCAHYQTETEFV